jgi:hypothetical protein
MEPAGRSGGGATVMAPPPVERALVWVGFPLVGAGAGWLLKSLAGWATSLPWVPFRGPLELVASAPDPAATIGSLALGIVGGLVVAVLAEQDYVRVSVDDDEVTIARGGSSRQVPRASVAAVFLDGKQLVLLGHATEELDREGGDLPDAKRLQAAFAARGCQAAIRTRTTTGAGWRTCPSCRPGPTPSSGRERGRWTGATSRTRRSSVGSWASSASWSAMRGSASSGGRPAGTCRRRRFAPLGLVWLDPGP